MYTHGCPFHVAFVLNTPSTMHSSKTSSGSLTVMQAPSTCSTPNDIIFSILSSILQCPPQPSLDFLFNIAACPVSQSILYNVTHVPFITMPAPTPYTLYNGTYPIPSSTLHKAMSQMPQLTIIICLSHLSVLMVASLMTVYPL